MQKKRNCVIAGMMMIILAVTGCSSEKEVDKDTGNEAIIIPVNEGREMDSAVQNQSNEGQNDITQNDMSESSNIDDAIDSIDDSAEMENIGGKVKSIAQDSFVISRVIVDENGMILVMPGEGGPDELLTTIYCTDSTLFEHWTIQGGGAGIEKKEAAFSDITEGVGLEAEGYFEGEEFIASKIIIEVYQ